MSFFNNEPQSWQAPVRQASWEQPPPPSRSGILPQTAESSEMEAKNYEGASSTSQREESNAFVTQFEGTQVLIGRTKDHGLIACRGGKSC